MKINYRPEIDSLRAIAVTLVIIYHYNVELIGIKLFSGGYIGVDIFFVISGYLITLLIYKELIITKNFSFKNFYIRRIRRIIPILLFVIIITIPFAYFFFWPSFLIDFANSVLNTLLFTSNFYFYFTNQEYQALSGQLKPFLHTWSLSIEEQFYLIFPFCFYLLFKYLNKYILFSLLFGLIISLSASNFIANSHPLLNFYLLIFRVWELLIGSLLAIIMYRGEKFKGRLVSILPLVGLIIIFLSAICFNADTRHPSFFTLIPIIGSLLILVFTNKDQGFYKFLTAKIFVFIGLISYSLYLWHYPILAFVKIYFPNNDIVKILSVFILLGLSILSYYCVEIRFRNSKIISNKFLFYFIFLMSLVIVLFSILTVFKKGYIESSKFKLENIISDNEYLRKERLAHEKKIPGNKFTNNSKTKVLIFGNSHGRDLFNAFNLNEDLYKNYDFAHINTDIYCLSQFFDRYAKVTKCLDIVNYQEEFDQSEYVILSSIWVDGEFEIIEKLILYLKEKNKKIIISSSNPYFYYESDELHKGQNIHIIDDFIIKNSRLPNSEENNNLKNKYFKNLDTLYLERRKKLLKIALLNDLSFLDKFKLVCNFENFKCNYLTDNREKIIFDSGHYTLTGAQYLGKKISKMNIFGY